MDLLSLIPSVGLSGAIVGTLFTGLIKGWFYPRSQIQLLLEQLKFWQDIAEKEKQRADIATEAMIRMSVTAEINAKLLGALPPTEAQKEEEGKNV